MLTMYDAVDLANVPPGAAAVAGYVNGKWPTYSQLATRFPKALHLSIAVTAEADADVLDVEPGDATNAAAPMWFLRQRALRPSRKPTFYTSLSNVKALVGVLQAAGIKRDEYKIWSAHYTRIPHLCVPGCGYGMPTVADATQYTDIALGRNLDASLVSAGFFPVSPAVRRRKLHAWILAMRASRHTWAWLKQTSKWRLWRRLGGK